MLSRSLLSISLLLISALASAAENRDAAEIVEVKCSLCHGLNGEGSSAIYPRLAGQHAEYITKQLGDLKVAGARAP